MNCSPFDLKDYFFGELSAADLTATEVHLKACAACREELARFGETRALLLSVPDEEPPRRIAFVSDKVFEPRWWQRLWASGPQLGFASAALLAAAILVHGFVMRPAAVITAAQVPATQPVSVTPVATLTQADVDRIVEAKLAQRQQEQMRKVSDLVNARTYQMEQKHRAELIVFGEALERAQRQTQQVRRVAYGYE
jgi:anti-sigma factor RsiW